MKKTILTVSSFVLLSLWGFGQDQSDKVELTWGQKYIESARFTLVDIVGNDETGIYAIKEKRGISTQKTRAVILEHYDHQMNRTKSVELKLDKEGEEKRNFEFIIHLGEELYICSSLKDLGVKSYHLYVQRIDKETLLPKNDLKKITETDRWDGIRYNPNFYNYALSRDSSKVLIYYKLDYEKDSKERIGLKVFDNRMNELWELNTTLPYTGELFEAKDYKIDSNGNVYILGKLYNDKPKEEIRGAPNYKYQILSYSDEGTKLQQYPIDPEGKFLNGMKIAIKEDQNIICSGFYSLEGNNSIHGSGFIRINSKTKSIEEKKFAEFGIDFLTQNMSDGKEKRTKKKKENDRDVALYAYKLDGIILKDDGGATLIGEQRSDFSNFRYSTNPIGQQTRQTNVKYTCNDIIVVSLSSNGEIEWAKKIQKKQETIDDAAFFSSYSVSVVKDKLHFIYNDHPKNLNYDGEGRIRNMSVQNESYLVLTTLGRDGILTKEALFSSYDADVRARPIVSEQISNNEMIVYGQSGRVHRYVRLSFN
ncbi:hypothetical protein [Phaeodactylibacter xiamenensis]|uniref:hypothetical protein n=1 Tax=Phaeodactylibacter xiamenensis TaxID=1524460 RepID=UPI0024A7F2E4|nr:hypothetical protein [Phaeodactylibacter xiamenensis]